jgi:hypothetical protein
LSSTRSPPSPPSASSLPRHQALSPASQAFILACGRVLYKRVRRHLTFIVAAFAHAHAAIRVELRIGSFTSRPL